MNPAKHRQRKGATALLLVPCILALLLAGCSKSPEIGPSSTPPAETASDTLPESASETATISESTPGSASETVPESTSDTVPASTSETVPESASEPTQGQASEPPQGEQSAPNPLRLPYQLEGGKLEITSLFQFTGFNPDCGLEPGTDIASLSFTNLSGEYLSSVSFTVRLTDGTQFRFAAADVPAGASVLAFSVDNGVYDASISCAAITCEAVFVPEAPMMQGFVSVSVEGTSITVTNLTGEDLTNLVIHCHTLFDEDYFGGLTYSYPVERMAAGSSITLQAEDCYLGEAAVVRITQGS